MVSGVNTCLSDYILAMEHAIDGESLLIFILHRDGQEFPEACSPFEPSGRHAWVNAGDYVSFAGSLWILKIAVVAIRSEWENRSGWARLAPVT